ncbi:MAG: acyl-CoA dehydratase activase-related protein [Bacillota bacterium]
MSKVTFPYLSNAVHPLTVLFEEMGQEVVVPFEPTKGTLDYGTKYAPEFACLPLKILLGTYIEGLERGADTIVASGGVGPCRAGYYAQLHREILASLGYCPEFIVFEPPLSHMSNLIRNVRALNKNKLSLMSLTRLIYRTYVEIMAMDRLEQALHRVRPRQITLKESDRIYKKGVEMIRSAKTVKEIREAGTEAVRLMYRVPQNPDREIVTIGIVGEIYVLLEPAANLYLETILGEMGAEVRRSMFLTSWFMDNVVVEGGGRQVKRAAKPYIPELIGGHGQDSVGHTVLYAQEGIDGVVQLAPFSCIPEIVAKGVLTKVSDDSSIPVLSVFLDEQTGEAGLRTRLEAFTDMLRSRKQARRKLGRFRPTTVSAASPQ